MATKIFLDTNIIIDVLDNKRPAHQWAFELFKQIEAGAAEAFISETVITTTDYLLQKILTKVRRVELLTALLETITILPLSNSICHKALQSNFNDLEDALLYQLAFENGMNYFVTNDTAAIKKLSTSLLPVISSKNLLQHL